MVAKWRGLKTHESAVFYSPKYPLIYILNSLLYFQEKNFSYLFSTIFPLTFSTYYTHVRINHCILPCSIGSLVENQSNINKLDIVRTKYYSYQNGKLVWSGLRIYKPDTLYKSIAFKQHPRPLSFASFLGCNAFTFYSQLVTEIGTLFHSFFFFVFCFLFHN